MLVSEVVRQIRDELPFTCNYSDMARIVTQYYPDALVNIPHLVVKESSRLLVPQPLSPSPYNYPSTIYENFTFPS